MDIKVEIEESCFMDICPQNEREFCSKDSLMEVKRESVISGSNCSSIDSKTEIEEQAIVSNFCSQNRTEFISEDPAIEYNKGSKGKELLEPKIEIKEEQCWVDTISAETLSIYDDFKNGTDGVFNSIKSSLSKTDVSSCTSHLFSNEVLEHDTCFSNVNDSPEYQSARRCQSQDTGVIAISSIKRTTCSETPDIGKIVGMASCFEQRNLHHQSNANKEDINKENCKSILSCEYRKADRSDISEKSLEYSSQGNTYSKKANKCNVCEKGFTHLSSLKRHKLIHEDINPHKCNICDKAFTDSAYLKIHKLIHDGIKPHKCDICNKAFAHLQHLKRHKLIHEGIKPHKCNVCEKAFTDLQHLKRHKLIHEGIKPHKCNICDKAFTRLQHLKRHKFIHEDTKPHKCNSCDKTFSRLQNLKIHQLIHEGIKPHKCNICEKKFTRLQYLKKHQFIHEGIKPHKCDICDKVFTQFQHLTTHKLIHEGIRPNKCDICNRAFTQLSTLKRHKLIHVDKNPH